MNPDAEHPYRIPAKTPGVRDIAPADPLEHAEPDEAHRPVSILYVTMLCALFAWGGYYVQRYSGAYGPLDYNENGLGLVTSTNAPAPVDPYTMGKRIFGDTCAKCHQPDGLGLPGQYPPLVGSEWVLAKGPARMIRIVLDGAQGPIKVKGLDFNNAMTPWRDTLTDQQIAAVITFVRTQKDWGHTASPVTPEEVAAIRKLTKDHAAAGAWNPAELLNVSENVPQP